MIWLALCWVMCQFGDYIRGRASADTTFDLSSIRHEQRNEAHGSKSRQTGISVAVHDSATSDFSRTDSSPNEGPTFEVPKPDASIASSQSPVVVQL
ncbi:hypothetical protein EDB83DRAFT_2345978 [Lactarius deliciosus]|nr:hypothetical protein EDB83DRAFT_2345978 [Lactarius deliciosus]